MNLDKLCIDEQHFRYSLMYENYIEPWLQNYNDTKSIAIKYIIISNTCIVNDLATKNVKSDKKTIY